MSSNKNNVDVCMEEHLLSKEPFEPFREWLEEACSRTEILYPNAMCLATATRFGCPSARYVILKEYDKEGFKFLTNYDSKKARQMDENSTVAATFFWAILNKSIRIEGNVEKLSEEESTKFFRSEPVSKQIAASVSYQSTPIESNGVFPERISNLQKGYVKTGKEIPKPKYWGGYIIRPRSIEFYQGQRDHLANRIRFRKFSPEAVVDGKLLHVGEDGWIYERLSP